MSRAIPSSLRRPLMRIFGPRAGLSSVLIVGAVVLLGAILIGNSMGNSVLGQIGSHPAVLVPTPYVPTPGPTDNQSAGNWKKTQVMAVATDPGFPDPRVTPEPPPPATPRPRPKQTKAPPTPQDTFDLETGPTLSPSGEPSPGTYTSPPLPIPIATPSETPEPEATPTTRPNGRGTPSRYTSPSLPPVPVQTLNP